RDRVIDCLGIAPFIILSLLFLIIPTLYLLAGAFLTPEGYLTLKNIGDLFTPSIMRSLLIKGALCTIGVETVLMEKLI
ncbi:hypothetical protein ACC685_39115, partial [Rhizobium ruizarguesonis]